MDFIMENKAKKYLIIAFVAIIVILLAILGIKIFKDQNERIQLKVAENSTDSEQVVEVAPQEQEKETEKNIEIFKGTDRPIAVMIDNHKGAWPQAGVNNAYLVYEIIVEGGETRLMALFKGVDVDVVGPVRSSRHYFLDYVLENDALYAHYGWSPKAKTDISSLGINNINGIYYDKPTFWRVSTKSSPHNAMTSTEQILSAAKKKNYRITSSETSVLNYVSDEVELSEGIDATEVYIPHSYLQDVTYKYNEKTQRYTRYARDVLQKDYNTGESVTTKNIIIEFVDNSVLNDGTNKDRQDLHNIGTFDGYYITNGKAIKIKCTKDARGAKTYYKDLSGNIIDINDGNTWINICPKKAKVTIK